MPLVLQAINVGSAPNDGTGDPGRTAFQKVNDNFSVLAGAVDDIEYKSFVVGCTGKGVALAPATQVEYFNMPYSFVLTGAKASVAVAGVGSDTVLDVLEGSTSVLSTSGLVIPAGSTLSAGSPESAINGTVILEENNQINFDIVSVGSGTPAEWLKITLLGYVIWTGGLQLQAATGSYAYTGAAATLTYTP